MIVKKNFVVNMIEKERNFTKFHFCFGNENFYTTLINGLTKPFVGVVYF